MKKTFLCLLLLLCTVSFAACSTLIPVLTNKAQPEEPLRALLEEPLKSLIEPTIAPTIASPVIAPTEESTPAPALPTAAAIEVNEEKIGDMLPIFDALILTQNTEDYASSDQDFFWIAMYLACVNDGTNRPDVGIKDYSQAIVPTQVIEEYASALFADFKEIPPLPADSGISYVKAQDAYAMALSDRGDSETAIKDFMQLSDHQIAVSVEFGYMEDETDRTRYWFVIEANPREQFNAVFYYSVVSVEESN